MNINAGNLKLCCLLSLFQILFQYLTSAALVEPRPVGSDYNRYHGDGTIDPMGSRMAEILIEPDYRDSDAARQESHPVPK